MPYFRIDDKLHSHVKAMRAGAPAVGLWALAGSWCMDQLTDGWVPEYAAQRLDPQAREHAADLVRAGLWHETERDGEPGWLFHEWDDWQHSREYLERRRAEAAERMRRARAQGGDVRANTADTAHAVTPTPTQPNPTNKKTPGAAAPETFEAFWSTYPRKVGKQAAAKAYAKALKLTDADTILAGLHAAAAGWRSCGTEARFIPHPSTWLNEGRWEDQEALPVGQQGVTRRDPAADVQAAYDLPPLPEVPDDVKDAGGKAYTTWVRDTRAAQRAALQDGGAP